MPKKTSKIVSFEKHTTGQALAIDRKGAIVFKEKDHDGNIVAGDVMVSAKELEQLGAYSDAASKIKLPDVPNMVTGGYETETDIEEIMDHGGVAGDVRIGCQLVRREHILTALKVSRKMRGRK